MSTNPNQEQEQSDDEEIELEMRLKTAALRDYIESHPGDQRRSDEEIRQFIAEYVDEHVQPVDEERVRKIVREELEDRDLGDSAEVSNEMIASVLREFGVETTITEVQDTRRAVEFPGRRVGPPEPRGSLHGNTHWGISFRVSESLSAATMVTQDGEQEGVAHIGTATVDAGESGTFTAQLGRYDGEEFDVVDERNIRVDEGVQEIALDFVVPEGGRYLLTRAGDFPLRRGEFADWDDHMQDGLKLESGAKPDSMGGDGIDTSDNSYWYFFFDLGIAAAPNHHLED